LEASLIGKALVFGSKECRFEPCVSKLNYSVNSYVANHFNILNSKKIPRITIKLTKKTLRLVNILYKMRVIQSYIISTKDESKYITFNSHYYRGIPYFSHLKVVSTPSKACNISVKALRVANKSLGNSIILLETDKGLITHIEAISTNTGGRILGVIS
jgi:ribosomal protein S8